MEVSIQKLNKSSLATPRATRYLMEVRGDLVQVGDATIAGNNMAILKECPKFKQVNVAHVPSLAEVVNDAITVPGTHSCFSLHLPVTLGYAQKKFP